MRRTSAASSCRTAFRMTGFAWAICSSRSNGTAQTSESSSAAALQVWQPVRDAVEPDDLAGHLVARHLLAPVLGEDADLQRADADRVQRDERAAGVEQHVALAQAALPLEQLVELPQVLGFEAGRQAVLAQRALDAVRLGAQRDDVRAGRGGACALAPGTQGNDRCLVRRGGGAVGLARGAHGCGSDAGRLGHMIGAWASRTLWQIKRAALEREPFAHSLTCAKLGWIRRPGRADLSRPVARRIVGAVRAARCPRDSEREATWATSSGTSGSS